MPNKGLRRRVILLTGTSSSGKTTLARAIQDESDTPFVYWGIDTLFGLVPPIWGGGSYSPLSRRGHFHTVHDPGYTYDMTIDTTTGTPATLARTIL
ncbi:hypothetical protein HGA13_20025 [Nocardia speluncae]|uniref:AAA domain-containing protein n=1 Tax=Nocardia speluncae TaxID=419477 RepID=A0A846XGS6_9NOCA|nr:hypothetical protein [Nocardia speluncae]NKY35338.1 hypothetical protein [Nocardia speluncae]